MAGPLPSSPTGNGDGLPARTRHVWVDQSRHVPPMQGLVIEWSLRPADRRGAPGRSGGRGRGSVWWALVVVVHLAEDRPPVTVTSWIPAERLIPVRSTPSGGPRHSAR